MPKVTINPLGPPFDFIGSGGGGSGTPSPPDTSVQFNDGGSFGGDAALVWDKTAKTLQLNAQPLLTGVVDDANDSEPAFVVYPASGNEASVIVATSFTDGSVWTGAILQVIANSLYLQTQTDGGATDSSIDIRTGSGGLTLLSAGGVILAASDVVMANSKAIKTDTTTAHTTRLQAYDVDGAAYVTFATLTNGNTPSFAIAQPAGGLLLVSPPTADPHVAGALWNNSGLAMISSG